MKQLTQRLRDGEVSVIDVPPPLLEHGMVLVRNHYSLISAGTEGSTVAAARKSLLGKAQERPQQVRQLLDVLAQQGPVQAYRAVQKKLEAYSPLGYSSAGEVVSVAADVQEFAVGDRVACAGAGYANHADVVAIPINLCVALPPGADLANAAYNSLGAIAMQGVRQADLRLGESCVVIGLGLLGQLTGLLLKAAGVRVIGVDINEQNIKLAAQHWADAACETGSAELEAQVLRLTSGIGADAVIITAATDSLEPINLAGRLLRKRGTVVVVGAVPTGFDREPDYYRKELSLKMSCSYGPGRYDAAYEAKGMDYPVAHVRWTERRNMDSFQRLLVGGLDLTYLTTHRFPLAAAPGAYDLILKKAEPYLGILIEYDVQRPLETGAVELHSTAPVGSAIAVPGVSFIGAGSYAMSHLLPNLARGAAVQLRGVVTATGTSSRSVAKRYGFAFCGADTGAVIADAETAAVFIATRHDTHARYVLDALRAGKYVFVEKPLALSMDQLEAISAAVRTTPGRLLVGFNRRFSPLVREVQRRFGAGPMSIIYRINAGAIAKDSWIQDRELGGGRIVGEVCHFIDTMVFLTGASPTRVHAFAMQDPDALLDTVTVNLQFDNGSVGSVCYFANGPKAMRKEHIEVYKDGQSAVIEDFRKLSFYTARRTQRRGLISQDKGQRTMVGEFIEAVRRGGPGPIPYAELAAVTEATLCILESLRESRSVALGERSRNAE